MYPLVDAFMMMPSGAPLYHDSWTLLPQWMITGFMDSPAALIHAITVLVLALSFPITWSKFLPSGPTNDSSFGMFTRLDSSMFQMHCGSVIFFSLTNLTYLSNHFFILLFLRAFTCCLLICFAFLILIWCLLKKPCNHFHPAWPLDGLNPFILLSHARIYAH